MSLILMHELCLVLIYTRTFPIETGWAAGKPYGTKRYNFQDYRAKNIH